MKNLFEGYNCTLLTYGSTGTGKSYSIHGSSEKGLLQLCLEQIFAAKENQKESESAATEVLITFI